MTHSSQPTFVLTLAAALTCGAALSLTSATIAEPPAGQGAPPSGAGGQGQDAPQGKSGSDKAPGQDGKGGKDGDRAKQRKRGEGAGGPGGPLGGGMGMMGEAMQGLQLARAALDKVEPPISDTQRTEIDAIRDTAKAQFDEWRAAHEEEIRSLMQEVRQSREAGAMDPALMEKMKALKESAPDLQGSIDKARNVLTPEQQKSFDDTFAKMKEEGKAKAQRRGQGGDGERPRRPGKDGAPGAGGPDGPGGPGGPGGQGRERPNKPGKDGTPPPPGSDKPVFED